MVVRVATTRRRHRIRQSLPRATVLLAGIAVLPTQSGSISLLPPRLQLRAIAGLPSGPQVPPYGNFVSPAGLPNPSLSFAFGWSLAGLPETWGSDPAVTTLLSGTVSAAADEFGVAGNPIAPAPTLTAAAPGGIRVVCEQVPEEVQAGGEYWNTQAGSGPPIQLPTRQFAENSLADPTRGPSGDSSNLSRQGPAGAWCRPSPVPFSDSSPLASRTLWTPIFVVLCGIIIFWLSRGVRLPP